jgi:hypothetical protein
LLCVRVCRAHGRQFLGRRRTFRHPGSHSNTTTTLQLHTHTDTHTHTATHTHEHTRTHAHMRTWLAVMSGVKK